MSRAFYTHGLFCASHPWEVIVFTSTLTLCILSMKNTFFCNQTFDNWNQNCTSTEVNNSIDIVIMTITRCMAVLYVYHNFCNLQKVGSKYVLGIAGLFTVFSSFVFSSAVLNFMETNFVELNEALPFFLLLIDLSKASLLAQSALQSSSQKEVRENIAQGMAVLGPLITLDTIVETLVISIGILSGVKRLEVLCWFACLSVIVNYLVFMTFFPACLSLMLELSQDKHDGHPAWQLKSFTQVLHDESQKPNPVLQRVKIIMSAGLLIVHVHSHWPVLADPYSNSVTSSRIDFDKKEPNIWFKELGRWLTVSTDQVVMMILALALFIKYVFFEAAHVHTVIQREDSGILQRNPSLTSQQISFEDKSVQTGDSPVLSVSCSEEEFECGTSTCPSRTLKECVDILKSEGIQKLNDDEIAELVKAKYIPAYNLEKALQNPLRGVGIRRKVIMDSINCPEIMEHLPYKNYEYSFVMGTCCENVIGYIPVPVGVAGPLLLDEVQYYVPLATTEGCLVASTNRGCRALRTCGGVQSNVVADGMTRGPVVRFPSANRAGIVMQKLKENSLFDLLKKSFDTSSRFAQLQRLQVRIAGRYLFIRFEATTGDAMGMNMLSKGTEIALKTLQREYPDMEILSLSGNYCTDKKAAAVNWIEGRGKSVVCEAIVPSKIVKEVLKTTTQSLIDVNISKNLIGSAVAGSIGGFNAQAANIVTAIFIATGQDPAQAITSSNCLTLLEPAGVDGEDLYISCTMPSLEVGTVGGGTVLPPQGTCLGLMGIQGPCLHDPGQHSILLARIVCATVLAGELSLLSALSAGHLVSSHLKHNRPNERLLGSAHKLLKTTSLPS